MEEEEYLQLAGTIPDDWYSDEEAKEITTGIFYNIMVMTAEERELVINDKNDLQVLLSAISEKTGVEVPQVLEDLKNKATSLGAVKYFELKYPQLVELFPKDPFGRPEYPPKFLGIILGVGEEVAENLISGVLEDYKEFLVDNSPTEPEIN